MHKLTWPIQAASRQVVYQLAHLIIAPVQPIKGDDEPLAVDPLHVVLLPPNHEECSGVYLVSKESVRSCHDNPNIKPRPFPLSGRPMELPACRKLATGGYVVDQIVAGNSLAAQTPSECGSLHLGVFRAYTTGFWRAAVAFDTAALRSSGRRKAMADWFRQI